MNDQPTRVIVLSYPNPDILAFAVNQQVCEVYRKGFHRPLRLEGGSWSAVGPAAQYLLQKLFDISGVLEVELMPYEVSVTKGSAFEWDAMQARDVVGSALVELFGQGISFEEQGPRQF